MAPHSAGVHSKIDGSGVRSGWQVIDAVAKSNCDLLFLCSYLADSIGLVRAVRAHPFRAKMVGVVNLDGAALGWVVTLQWISRRLRCSIRSA